MDLFTLQCVFLLLRIHLHHFHRLFRHFLVLWDSLLYNDSALLWHFGIIFRRYCKLISFCVRTLCAQFYHSMFWNRSRSNRIYAWGFHLLLHIRIVTLWFGLFWLQNRIWLPCTMAWSSKQLFQRNFLWQDWHSYLSPSPILGTYSPPIVTLGALWWTALKSI